MGRDRVGATKVLFFCRGRGRGHAVPSMAIAAELQRLLPLAQLTFVSYGMGAKALAEGGHDVVELDVSSDGPFLSSLMACSRLIASERPDVVVSHEEFPAAPAARAFGCPNCFIVDFFLPEDAPWMDALRYADEILFTEHRGIFAEPSFLRGKVRYLAPVVRIPAVTRGDQKAMRQLMGVSGAPHVISVIPGAWATEQRAPIFDLVTAAFGLLPGSSNRLVWIAGDDHDALVGRGKDLPGLTILRSHSPIEQLMVASDLVITKANRGTIVELAHLGIPSLSLSYRLNPIDEIIVPRIRTNHALDVRGVDAPFLSSVINRLLHNPASLVSTTPSPLYPAGGAAKAATELARFITDRVRPVPRP